MQTSDAAFADEVIAEVIQGLRQAGYVVLKRKSYDTRNRRMAQLEQQVEDLLREARYSRDRHTDQHERNRHLSDRLDRVIAAAAGQGVSIQAINDALDGLDQRSD